MYLRTPLIALIAALSLVVPTTALASGGPVEPPPPEAPVEAGAPAAETTPPAGEEPPLPAEQSVPPPLPAEEIPPAPDPAELPSPTGGTPTDPEAPPATGDPGGALPVEAGFSPEVIPPADPAMEPGIAPVEGIEPVVEPIVDPGELNFPVAPAPDGSPSVANLSPEEVAPTAAPVKPVAPPQPPRPETPVEPSTPVGGGDVLEPVSASLAEPDLAMPSPLPLPVTPAPDPKPIVGALPEEPLPEPVSNPFPVRPLVVVDPPTVVEPEPVLVEPAPITPADPEAVASEVPAPPATQGSTEDPIHFPTAIHQSGETEPPPAVALEIPFDTSGAPPPASSSASASSSSSGVTAGVGPAALAALFVVIALGAAATVRLTTHAWRSSYLLSLPERPG